MKEIAVASMGYWGYEQERVRDWADQGDFSPKPLTERALSVMAVELDG